MYWAKTLGLERTPMPWRITFHAFGDQFRPSKIRFPFTEAIDSGTIGSSYLGTSSSCSLIHIIGDPVARVLLMTWENITGCYGDTNLLLLHNTLRCLEIIPM